MVQVWIIKMRGTASLRTTRVVKGEGNRVHERRLQLYWRVKREWKDRNVKPQPTSTPLSLTLTLQHLHLAYPASSQCSKWKTRPDWKVDSTKRWIFHSLSSPTSWDIAFVNGQSRKARFKFHRIMCLAFVWSNRIEVACRAYSLKIYADITARSWGDQTLDQR